MNYAISFIPAALRGDPETQRKAHLMVALCAHLALCVPPLMALFWFGFKVPLVAHLLGISAILAGSAPLLLKHTGSIPLAGNWMVAQLFWITAALTILSGGHGAAATLGFLPLPLLASLLSGWRSGVAWGVISATSLWGFYQLHIANVALFQVFYPWQLELLIAMALSGFTALLMTAGALSDHQTRLALGEARQQALDEAEAQQRGALQREIAEPVNALAGISALMMETPLDERQVEYARAILTSSEVLSQILSDLVDDSVVASDQEAPEFTDFDLRELVEAALGRVARRAPDRALRLELGPGVPQGVTGDPGRVAEALELMLDDALMATEAGRVIARLRCDERNPDSAVVTVEIEAEGPFDALTPPPALEACRALATEVGGELGVERRGGRRAAWLRLPLDLCQLSPPASAGDRVLVVEDNPVNQRLICSMLTKLGLAYDVADNGAEAVRAFRERAYSLVLMDCMMPEMDGYEATRAIRGMEPAGAHATIIAVTACALPEDRERCLEAGMDDYLTKPLTLGTLSETLESWRPQRAAS